MIKIGDMVVCVDGRFNWNVARDEHFNRPIQGNVYTVRDFFVSKAVPGQVGIMLEEIRNKIMVCDDGSVEPNFHIKQFRKVKKTNIKCFTEILEKLDA